MSQEIHPDDLLNQWLDINDNIENNTGDVLKKAPSLSEYPLSAGQRRLWIVCQKKPESPVYNYSEIWIFNSGSFELSIFKQSIKHLIDKHKILASNYIFRSGQPKMIIRNHTSPNIVIGKEGLSENDSRSWLKRKASKPFDLTNEMLFRIIISPVNNDTTHVALVFHHIIVDAWSLDLLKKDFCDFYSEKTNRFSSETFLEIDTNNFSFTDYAYWDNETKGKVPKQDKNSVAKSLSISPLSIPTEYVASNEVSHNGKLKRFRLSGVSHNSVKKILSKHQSTASNFFLAAYHVLLSNYSSEKTIGIGMPVLNRDSEQLKSIVGYLVETQVVALPFDPKKSFIELLSNIRGEVLDALTGNKPGYDELVTSTKSDNKNRNPVFQTMFVAHNSQLSPFKERDLSIDVEVLDLDISKFDLTLHLFENPDQFEIGFEYSTDLFSSEYINKLFNHFEILISAICQEPGLSVGSYSMISEKENQWLTYGINSNFQDKEDGKIISQIEQCFNEFPYQVAIVCGEESLTYSELDKESLKIAQALNKRKADRDKPIGIYMDRSLDFVISIIGVLRFGGYYLPLDPEYPEDRIHQYLSESAAELVLFKGNLAPVKQDQDWVNTENLLPINDIIGVDGLRKSMSKYAYIIFTSGSSNQPKGVKVSQSNLFSSNSSRIKYYKDLPNSFLLLSSFSFDSSVAGLFWTLSTGGKLVIARKEEQFDVSLLDKTILEQKITHTLMLPSLYTILLKSIKHTPDYPLKKVILAGEEFPRSLVKQHFEKLPAVDIYNEYGPTEGTVWCAVQQVSPKMGRSKIPIGSPISNTLVYILDKNQILTPQGLIGELYIGGKGVVEGYTDEKLNIGKFIENPFRTEDKLYRTGDLVRIQQDGLLEFIGRADNQVKISGHRIELDEIQQIALTHRKVSEAAAFPVISNSNDTKELGLVFSANENIPIQELTELLRKQLPAFMVPSKILQVDKIARLPNGKVDVTALQLTSPQVNVKNVPVTFQNSYLIRQMMHIWGDVMGLDNVPIDVDFFELGGTSLQSIRIIAMCKDMGFKITPAQFLRYSTIKTLVDSLDTNKYERPSNTLELEVLKIWESNVGQSLIGINDPYGLYYRTNSQFEQMREQLKSRFKIDLKFDEKITIKTIADHIRKKRVGGESDILKRIIPIKTTGTSNPIFCIHSEFYYETVYTRLVSYFPDHIPVYSVLSVSPQLISDVMPRNIEDIARFCIDDIVKIKPSGPYNILSYSIGNVVAFEIAKQLIEAGLEVRLFIIDPPLFLNKSQTFLAKIAGYISKPRLLFSKIENKIKQPKKIRLIKDTGLLKKYIFHYKPEHINCDTVFINTPSAFKNTYDWDSLVNVKHKEIINGPHDKLMREPHVRQISDSIIKYIYH